MSFHFGQCGIPDVVKPVLPSAKHSTKLQNNLTVCVHGALKRHFFDYHMLIEFIEVYTLFGAEKFVVYISDVDQVMDQYLKYYQSYGLLDVYLFLRPNGLTMRDQEILISDAMMRYMYRTRYLLLVNLDEIITPYLHENLVEMVDSLECSNAYQFKFRNVFFRLEEAPDERAVSNSTLAFIKSKTLTYTKRDTFTFNYFTRTKVMVKPELVAWPSVHTMRSSFLEKDDCQVPQEVAIMHHYRNCSEINLRDKNTQTDDFLYKLKEKIVSRMLFVLQAVG